MHLAGHRSDDRKEPHTDVCPPAPRSKRNCREGFSRLMGTPWQTFSPDFQNFADLIFYFSVLACFRFLIWPWFFCSWIFLIGIFFKAGFFRAWIFLLLGFFDRLIFYFLIFSDCEIFRCNFFPKRFPFFVLCNSLPIKFFNSSFFLFSFSFFFGVSFASPGWCAHIDPFLKEGGSKWATHHSQWTGKDEFQ